MVTVHSTDVIVRIAFSHPTFRNLAKMKKWYNANAGAREFADDMALGADPYYTMKW